MLKSLCIALHLCSSISGPAMAQDGDTVYVHDNGGKYYAIRLWGLDAEELNEPYGKMARDKMSLFIFNSEVTCELTGEKSYNRYVASCSVHGNDLAALMIANGFALDCAHYSGGRYRKLEPMGVRKYLLQKPYCN